MGLNSEKPTDLQVKNLSRAMNISKSKVSENYWELLSKAVEDGIQNVPEVDGYKRIANFLYNRARESGVEVG